MLMIPLLRKLFTDNPKDQKLVNLVEKFISIEQDVEVKAINHFLYGKYVPFIGIPTLIASVMVLRYFPDNFLFLFLTILPYCFLSAHGSIIEKQLQLKLGKEKREIVAEISENFTNVQIDAFCEQAILLKRRNFPELQNEFLLAVIKMIGQLNHQENVGKIISAELRRNYLK